jgi:tetratricopeptide (TPR) repeat protein
MSKKEKVSPPPATSSWTTFAIIALLGGLLGATLASFVLRRPTPLPGAVSAGTTHPDPTAHRPDPNLAAGQPPAQADRTLGNFYYDHQNWPKAIEHYQSAIRQGSDDADIRTDLGNVYRFAGRPDDALAQYHLAQKMSPTHEFSLFNQGGLYLEDFKQPARAVEIWQEYLTRFPAGRNAEAARQLIARTQGGAVLPALPPPGVPATQPAPQTSPAEDLILRQIEAGRSKPSQP